MPLDPAWPLRRLQELCDEAQPAVVVWAAAGSPGSGGHGAPPVTGWPLAQLPELSALAAQAEGKPLAAPAAAAGATAAETAAAAAPSGGDACCCYVLYTSGSTGRPLGVCGTQRGVLNRCRWLQAAHPFQVLAGEGQRPGAGAAALPLARCCSMAR